MFSNTKLPDGRGKITMPATFFRSWDGRLEVPRPLYYPKYEKVSPVVLLRRRRTPLVSGHRPTLGADPEIFVVDQDGKVIPAWEFLPKRTDQSRVYWDGWQAEFQVTPPVTCLGYFTDYVRNGLVAVAAKMPANGRLSLQSVLPVDTKGVSAEHVALGCAPSLNVYGEEALPNFGPRDVPVRFAGGHIHFGIRSTGAIAEGLPAAVKMMDRIVGLSAVCLARDYDRPERRRLYGRAGEYRLPKHGLEYRVLSNFWLCAPEITHLTFELARMGFCAGLRRYTALFQGTDRQVQDIINSTDPVRALALLKKNKPLLRRLFTGSPLADWSGLISRMFNTYWRALEGGVGAVLKDPDDIAGNWRIGGPWQTHSDNEFKTWHTFCSPDRA